MTNQGKPNIIVLSPDDDTTFRWFSDGWHTLKQAHTKKAKDLMKRALKAINEGDNVPDVINKLKKAGFSIERGDVDYVC